MVKMSVSRSVASTIAYMKIVGSNPLSNKAKIQLDVFSENIKNRVESKVDSRDDVTINGAICEDLHHEQM